MTYTFDFADSKKVFSLHDNVLAKWTDNKWYSAQVYQVLGDGRYSVYFTGDDEVLDVHKSEMKHPPRNAKGDLPFWARMKRDKFVGLDFKYKKDKDSKDPIPDGTYNVKQMGEGEDINKYVCLQHRAQGTEDEYLFHMGYVQAILLQDIFACPP